MLFIMPQLSARKCFLSLHKEGIEWKSNLSVSFKHAMVAIAHRRLIAAAHK
jgi:hypothetical protein